MSEVITASPLPLIKLTKACSRCHIRKLKCDARIVGLPCSRCSENGSPDSCTLAPRQRRQKPGPKPRPSAASNSRQSCGTLGSNDLRAPESIETKESNAQSQGQGLSRPRNEFLLSSEAHIRVCRELVMGDGIPSPEKVLDPTPGRDIIEYHNGLDYLSILGHTLSRDKRRRVARIVIDDEVIYSGTDHSSNQFHLAPELSGLCSMDRDYLIQKGVFTLPPRECVTSFLKRYFEMVHPYSPVIDRVELLESYESGRYSTFLIQAVLAIAALYAPQETILASGFTNREAAQASFFNKATILYDFRCERSQLRLLQGSLILSGAVLSYSLDKDFRYWFLNAVRLAVKMGLHKSHVIDDMDPETYKLCKRIWWVIYSRDVSLSFTGHQNMRMLTNNICDTSPLEEDDWDEEAVPERFENILPPVTLTEKLFFMEICKLAVIGSKCLSSYKDKRDRGSDEVGCLFETWRQCLSPALRPTRGQRAGEEIWYTYLLATSYRFESVLYRISRTWWQDKDSHQHTWAKRRLRESIFELDTVIGRVVANDNLLKFPLSFIGCIPALLALYIEAALDSSDSQMTRSMAELHIPQIMLILRRLDDFPTIRKAILVFEWVLSQKDLQYLDSFQRSTVDGASHSEKLRLGANREHDIQGVPMTSLASAPDVSSESGQWFEEFLGFDFLDNLALLE